jgi:hypothetical protein
MIPKPRGGQKRMTIAVGFRCVDGIMLCADTQETLGGFIKKKKSKIDVRGSSAHPFGSAEVIGETVHPCAVFAGAADDADFLDALIDKLWATMEPKEKDGIEGMIEGAEDALIARYGKLVSLYPSGFPDIAILIGVWAENKFELVKITGPVLKRGIALESIGFGSNLATYITTRLVYPKSWLSLSVPVGMYVIDQVKLYVEGCSGDTQMTVIRGNGRVESCSEKDAEEETKRFRVMDWAAREIVGLAMHSHQSMEQFNALVEEKLAQLRKAVHIEPPPKAGD